MISDEVKKSAMFIARFLAVEANRDGKDFDRIQWRLNDEEKGALLLIMKSMVLMTSGNTDTIRNPDLFDESKAERWDAIIGRYARRMHSIGLKSYDKITKQDYINAKKFLPIFGQMSANSGELKNYFKTNHPTIGNEPGFDTASSYSHELYRGLHNISYGMAEKIINDGFLDITRAVSTSRDYRTAKNFASKETWKSSGEPYVGPICIVVIIKNYEDAGLAVGKLSYFEGEDEVILSGKLNISNVEFLYSEGIGKLVGSQIYAKSYKTKEEIFEAFEIMKEKDREYKQKYNLVNDDLSGMSRTALLTLTCTHEVV